VPLLEALKVIPRNKRRFLSVTSHQYPQKRLLAGSWRATMHKKCQKFVKSIILLWQMLCLTPRTIFYNLEALIIKTRDMRVFVRVTVHQGLQKWILGKILSVTTHQNCHKCVWRIILLWQMPCLAPRTIFYNLETLKFETRSTRAFLKVTTCKIAICLWSITLDVRTHQNG
jgi:hypothetical protein